VTSAAAYERPALGIALTGMHGELEELAEGLHESETGITVLGQVPDVHAGGLEAVVPQVVVHCPWWSGADGQSAAQILADDVAAIRRQTAAPIVLLVTGGEPGVVEADLEAGVEDILLVPQRIESIAFSVRKAGQAGARRLAAVPDQPETGQVITVFSPKGGTGKTVLATNVACYLAAKSRKRVLLIDLDLQFGDAAIMLGLDPERTMFDLVQAGGDLDPGKLTGYTTRHKSGLDVLVAPMLPEHAEQVTEAFVMRLVEVAREAYDLVLIDTSPFFYGPMLGLLRSTDQLLMLCGLDVPTLKNVRLSLRTLELLGFESERTRLVVNRVAPDVGVTAREVEEALGVPVAFEVPNDPVVAPSVNRGAVPALKEADSSFAAAIALVAATFDPALAALVETEPPASGGGATRLRRLMVGRVAEGRS
jgi:pilus assembly protein CpaE